MCTSGSPGKYVDTAASVSSRLAIYCLHARDGKTITALVTADRCSRRVKGSKCAVVGGWEKIRCTTPTRRTISYDSSMTPALSLALDGVKTDVAQPADVGWWYLQTHRFVNFGDPHAPDGDINLPLSQVATLGALDQC